MHILTKPIFISAENHWKKIAMELPRDSDWHDYVQAFNTILHFSGFNITVQEIVKEEIICKYEEENSIRINESLISNNQ